MKNKFFLTGILIIIFVFGLVFIGCDDSINDEKTVDSSLIGKWEWEKIFTDEEEISLPFIVYGTTVIASGGYEFSSSSFNSYLDGRIEATMTGVYTQNNKFYDPNGQAGLTYSISGNKLTITDGSYGIIAKKVTKFSWE